MYKLILKRFFANQKGEINMIAIVLILLVVIMLAVIFRDGMEAILKSIFSRVENEISNI